MNEQFKIDVDKGLSNTPKSLPSRYFYDEKGDELFVKIMHSPEYYVTDAELEIFQYKTPALVKAISFNPFDLIELGAGDGTKTYFLLKELLGKNITFKYVPTDISQHALKGLKKNLTERLDKIDIETMQGEYFEVLKKLTHRHPKVILFLGSNIGNMLDERAKLFMDNLSASMQKGDKLLLGVDLIKSKDIILPAYNDSQGYTSEFNLNLLNRINKELGGHFDLSKFEHAPVYDEKNGIALSYLKSTEKQDVKIDGLNKKYHFEKGETIHTEISRKYSLDTVKEITKGKGLTIQEVFYDSRKYFADILLIKN